MTFHVVIPARHASVRLPGKPLLDLGGRTMIQRVVDRAGASGARLVLVATDDLRIAQAVSDPRGGQASIAVMTDAALPSGTDRVAAVAHQCGWSDDTIVVNVQGDEPFVPPRLIDQVASLLLQDSAAAVATLAAPIASLHEFLDPNVVKVVVADDGAALYFSRAPIPWSRDGAAAGAGSQTEFAGALRRPRSSGPRSSSSCARCRPGCASWWLPAWNPQAPASTLKRTCSWRVRAWRRRRRRESHERDPAGRAGRDDHAVEAGRLRWRRVVCRTLVRADVLFAPPRPARGSHRFLADEHQRQPAAAVVLHLRQERLGWHPVEPVSRDGGLL
jgi:3-deoxy-manno-octulosonate cytidylyltransferase (CMP-KDO synthetase)